MLPAEAAFDQETLDSVLDSGHSRIPIYSRGNRQNIIGLVLVKDLLRHKPDAGVVVANIRMRSIPRYEVQYVSKAVFEVCLCAAIFLCFPGQPAAACETLTS